MCKTETVTKQWLQKQWLPGNQWARVWQLPPTPPTGYLVSTCVFHQLTCSLTLMTCKHSYKMLQDCLLILHVLTQIMTFNYYAIEVTFVSKSLSVLLHFIANTVVLFLLLFYIFAWKSCGFKVHFCIVLLHIAKLTIVCINFAITTVHFYTIQVIFDNTNYNECMHYFGWKYINVIHTKNTY